MGSASRASPPPAAGASALATDSDAEALDLVERNARKNGLEVETLPVDWSAPDELIGRAPFDLVLAADVLYERPGVAQLLELLPQLAPEAWIADPSRPAAEAFFEQVGGGAGQSRPACTT